MVYEYAVEMIKSRIECSDMCQTTQLKEIFRRTTKEHTNQNDVDLSEN